MAQYTKRWTVTVREEDLSGGSSKRYVDRKISVEDGSRRTCMRRRTEDDFVDGVSFDGEGLGLLVEAFRTDVILDINLLSLAKAAFELGRRFERKYPNEPMTVR